MKKKGFTLIELLVVIAIIGILATIASISMGSARKKARDSKRVADINQMKTAMELWYNDKETYAGGCGHSDEGTGVLTKSCLSSGDNRNPYITWNTVTDPTEKGKGATPCQSGVSETCDYTIKVSADDFEICFYLENGVGGLDAGLYHMSKGGISSGCNITGL